MDCKVTEVVKGKRLYHSGMGVFYGEMMTEIPDKIENKSTSDLVIVGLMIIVTSIIAMSLRYEKMVELFLIHKLWGVDEMFLIGALSVAICSIWYSWRRLSESKLSEARIRENEARYSSVVESTDDSIYLVDRDCRYLYMNRKHTLRLGLNGKQIKDRKYSEIHSPNETKWFSERINTIFVTGKSEQHEYKSGSQYFLQTFSPVKNKNNETIAVTVISKDVTALKREEGKLRNLSFTDELTGLYNRRGFFAMAKQQITLAELQGNGMILIYTDLDGMKGINDKLGHTIGDLAISDTANALLKTFRRADMIARIGGDEFVILATETPGTDIETLISRLKENLNTYNDKPNRNYELKLSVGVARYDPTQPCSLEELLSKADTLMYEDKQKKKFKILVV